MNTEVAPGRHGLEAIFTFFIFDRLFPREMIDQRNIAVAAANYSRYVFSFAVWTKRHRASFSYNYHFSKPNESFRASRMMKKSIDLATKTQRLEESSKTIITNIING